MLIHKNRIAERGKRQMKMIGEVWESDITGISQPTAFAFIGGRWFNIAPRPIDKNAASVLTKLRDNIDQDISQKGVE